MSRQAQVGVFTVIALVALFVMGFYIADLPARIGAYKVGVHFRDAAGLRAGAQVLESGVAIGTVDSIQLQPDFSVDVILSIRGNVDIPRNSRFIIQAPLTGEPNLVIAPPPPERFAPSRGPAPLPTAIAILPREVLPIDEQPAGTNPITLQDLLEQGQGQLATLSQLLDALNKRAPGLLATLQSTLDNANQLTISANQTFRQFAQNASQLSSQLGAQFVATSNNLNQMTSTLNATTQADAPRLTALLTSLDSAAVSLNETMDSFKSLAQNPQMRQNLIDTTQSIAKTAATIAQITEDLRTVSGNPQTQAQLRDTVANLDATSQKVNYLLAELGAKSSVYGVDQGAAPAPVLSPLPGGAAPPPNAAPPPSGANPSGVRQPASTLSPSPFNIGDIIKQKVAQATRSLVSVDIRESYLSPYYQGTNASPLLNTPDRGPQTDFNLFLFPNGKTSLYVGANDIGQNTSWNFAGVSRLNTNFSLGGGVIYSTLGFMGSAQTGTKPGSFGLDTAIYNPRHPTLDGYGRLKLYKGISVYYGERDITHTGRRSVFGLDTRF